MGRREGGKENGMALMDELRRVVTENTGGRSRVAADGGPAANIASEDGEVFLAEIWNAALKPDAILADADGIKTEPVSLEPDKGALKVRWFSVAPEDPQADPALVDELADFAFALANAAHVRVDTTRHPMMHKTETLDVIICVKGAVTLLLDAGEAKDLKPGDVVIQRATNHAWVNHGSETAILVAVLIDAG